jgi:tetratricopeptide (TPR) repeat protein
MMTATRNLTPAETGSFKTFLKTGKLQEAEDFAASLDDDVQDNPEVPFTLSRIAATDSKLDKALSYARKAASLSPPNEAKFHRQLMLVAQRLQFWEEAEAAGLRAVAVNPGDSDAMRRLGEIKIRQDDEAAATNWAIRLGAVPTSPLPELAWAISTCIRHKSFRAARQMLNTAAARFGAPEDQEAIGATPARAKAGAKKIESSFKRGRAVRV